MERTVIADPSVPYWSATLRSEPRRAGPDCISRPAGNASPVRHNGARHLSALIPPKCGKDLVHVLIVGVAGYQPVPGRGSPKELPAIVKSVERAADFWRASGMVLKGRTVGSIEVVLSPGSQSTALVDTDGAPLEEATLINVRAAFDAWRGRCASSPDSLAVVHWLGHGAADMAPKRRNTSAMTLYCYDVDFVDPALPMRRGVSLSETVWFLQNLSFAPDALFFIDACRSHPSDADEGEYPPAVTSSLPSKSGKNNRITVYNLLYDDTEAYCRPGAIPECGFRGGSAITEAVLDALEHFAWPQKAMAFSFSKARTSQSSQAKYVKPLTNDYSGGNPTWASQRTWRS